ncbi:ThiF family adenylyltransferase [bacterium]|nr:ThiF family adenylyltransferase [bacterium]
MLITLPEDILTTIVNDKSSVQGNLYGHIRDDGDVIQIAGVTPDTGSLVGNWQIETSLPDKPVDIQSLPIILVMQKDEANPPKVQAYYHDTRNWMLSEVMVIRRFADFDARIKGLFEVGKLAYKRVTIIGLGTGGAVVAAQLVRCGVGNFRLVDFDRLEVHNIARHVCDLRDIGRYKTRALRDLLINTSPFVQVETYEVNILADLVQLEEIIEGSDLVVAATDSEESKMAINQVCWQRGIPAVYGAAYNRAFGGDVFRVASSTDACYACFHTVVAEFFGPPPAATDDFSPGYADPSKMADLIAEPGLAMDAGMIALILTRVALLTLLRDVQTSLPDFTSNWILFGNRAEWIFQKPLESIFIDVPKRSDCPVCNYTAYASSNLGMSVDQARENAQQILQELPQIDISSRIHPHYDNEDR